MTERRHSRDPEARDDAASRESDHRANATTTVETPDAKPADPRHIDDPARLAEEARAQTEQFATQLRGTHAPIETEPPTTYRA